MAQAFRERGNLVWRFTGVDQAMQSITGGGWGIKRWGGRGAGGGIEGGGGGGGVNQFALNTALLERCRENADCHRRRQSITECFPGICLFNPLWKATQRGVQL